MLPQPAETTHRLIEWLELSTARLDQSNNGIVSNAAREGIRMPLSRSSVGSWKNYEQELDFLWTGVSD